MRPWRGVDFDGTLAKHQEGADVEHVGEPVPAMVERVKRWLSLGQEVRIVTARVGMTRPQPERERQISMIHAWCREHIGVELPVVCSKDYGMIELWDDRAIQVERNTGRTIEEATAQAIAAELEQCANDPRALSIAKWIRMGHWR